MSVVEDMFQDLQYHRGYGYASVVSWVTRVALLVYRSDNTFLQDI